MRMGVAIQGSGRRDGTKHPNAFDVRLAGTEEVLCTSETPFFTGREPYSKRGRRSPTMCS